MTRARGAALLVAVSVAIGGAVVLRVRRPADIEPSLPPSSAVMPRDAGGPAPAAAPASPAAVEAPPAPRPGPMPLPAAPSAPVGRVSFAPGERARYDVTWLGLGAGLPAGTAEFVVSGGGSPGRYRFELQAATAAWVSAFFEAKDRFWTETTADLYPVVHGQDLREGRRHVERLARFDRDARLVRIGSGALENPADGVSRALSPEARDPIGAMYFVRTLPWDREEQRRLLVSDLGLDLAVDVRASRAERVQAEGRAQDAHRLTIRMEYVTEPYKTPKATVWLSADARRIPLAAEVETDVGVFRMALVAYSPGGRPPAPPLR